ncbi:C4-dicarboxylate ABC transporter substrate-binding protein [Desulfosarcina widdelii]|uniref:C4-dicarboxylate ABC transporter substrate-binding protein n=1 Tax=Desulfosarcina widdelii TaxID=947919 RepID=A0A5K7YX69_9BACT|nr:TRAP transporter substrate-binding protein DctP [Desulfosarcina widdelii]BBO72639.1 C4-dicarboxylate ABC transporter substrate-binding protein [Desulfosarcina widdelii]
MKRTAPDDKLSRRNFIKGTTAVIGAAALTGVTTGNAKAESKPIRWRMQGMYAETNMAGKFAFRWAKSVTDVTNGRLKVQCGEPGSIVPAKELFQAVSSGMLDAAGSFGPFYRGIMPEVDVEAGLPFAWETPQECHDGFYNYGLLEEFRKIYAEHGIFYAAPAYCNIIYGYPTTKPVRKPSDFKGMKMRDLGLSADWLAHFGAAPTALPAGEMYMALKMGTIDGVHYGTACLEDFKLGEVCKYYLLEPNTGTTVLNILINMESYEKLPADLKELLKNYSQTFTLAVTAEWDENRSWIESSKKYNIEGIRWSAEDSKMAKEYMIKTLWKKVSGKSPRCKKLVDIVYEQAAHLGKI